MQKAQQVHNGEHAVSVEGCGSLIMAKTFSKSDYSYSNLYRDINKAFLKKTEFMDLAAW